MVSGRLLEQIPSSEIRAIFDSLLPKDGSIPRVVLLEIASKRLGYARLGRQLRSRLNKTLYAEIREGLLCTDGFDNVMRRQPLRRFKGASTIISVPTIGEGLTYSHQLCALWSQAMCAERSVAFNFSSCAFLSQRGVAFLGGLARLMEQAEHKVAFDWGSIKENIKMNLMQNGFHAQFGSSIGPWRGNSIPYREDADLDKYSLVHYLADQWLGRDWVHLSDDLRNAVASTVSEIYVNAFEHSQSSIGVFSCGQHYPNRRMVSLTAVDFGVGIPQKVRSYKNSSVIESMQQWSGLSNAELPLERMVLVADWASIC